MHPIVEWDGDGMSCWGRGCRVWAALAVRRRKETAGMERGGVAFKIMQQN